MPYTQPKYTPLIRGTSSFHNIIGELCEKCDLGIQGILKETQNEMNDVFFKKIEDYIISLQENIMNRRSPSAEVMKEKRNDIYMVNLVMYLVLSKQYTPENEVMDDFFKENVLKVLQNGLNHSHQPGELRQIYQCYLSAANFVEGLMIGKDSQAAQFKAAREEVISKNVSKWVNAGNHDLKLYLELMEKTAYGNHLTPELLQSFYKELHHPEQSPLDALQGSQYYKHMLFRNVKSFAGGLVARRIEEDLDVSKEDKASIVELFKLMKNINPEDGRLSDDDSESILLDVEKTIVENQFKKAWRNSKNPSALTNELVQGKITFDEFFVGLGSAIAHPFVKILADQEMSQIDKWANIGLLAGYKSILATAAFLTMMESMVVCFARSCIVDAVGIIGKGMMSAYNLGEITVAITEYGVACEAGNVEMQEKASQKVQEKFQNMEYNARQFMQSIFKTGINAAVLFASAVTAGATFSLGAVHVSLEAVAEEAFIGAHIHQAGIETAAIIEGLHAADNVQHATELVCMALEQSGVPPKELENILSAIQYVFDKIEDKLDEINSSKKASVDENVSQSEDEGRTDEESISSSRPETPIESGFGETTVIEPIDLKKEGLSYEDKPGNAVINQEILAVFLKNLDQFSASDKTINKVIALLKADIEEQPKPSPH
jgi:hypothetical protein